MSEDPFEGISDKDIEKYSDLFDIPPPDNDDEAFRLSKKIKEWISKGRPHPKDELKKDAEEIEDLEKPEEYEKEDSQKEKPKKKRGLFGLFRK